MAANRSVRTFKTNSSKNEELEPIAFKIDDETFEAKPSVSGLAIMELVADSGKGGAEAMGAILRYLRKAMTEEEYAHFEKYVEDNTVEGETINEIIGFLIESHSDRPTK